VNILWISGSFRSGETAVVADGVAAVWQAAHHVTYWPLGGEHTWIPPHVSETVPAGDGRGPFGRIQLLGQMRRAFLEHDLIVVEQDLATEFLAAEAAAGLRHRGQLWLFARMALGHYLAGRGEHLARRPRRLAETLYPRFDRIVTLVAGVADDLASRFGVSQERLSVLPWPCSTGGGPSADFRPRVVALGHVDGVKGMELLVQGLNLLHQDGVDAELAIVGDGPRLEPVRDLARSLEVPVSVRTLTPDTLQALGGGVFHAPQWLDGTGWELVVAASHGLPLTAVSAPEAAMDITRRGVLGKLTGLGDLEGLKTVLGTLLASEEAWNGYHQGALTLARAYHPDIAGPRWLSLLTQDGGR
jgi:glycosyltransferase involved in cell wall biosynthesis